MVKQHVADHTAWNGNLNQSVRLWSQGLHQLTYLTPGEGEGFIHPQWCLAGAFKLMHEDRWKESFLCRLTQS